MSAATQRLVAIDAARGFAMCFVCLSHFSALLESTRPALAEYMAAIAMIATPTFLLLSGAMLGLLQNGSSRASGELSRRLFHRGLLVVLVGHLLISLAAALAHAQPYRDVLFSRIYVTDVVGICLMTLPRVTKVMQTKWLVVLGFALYAFALLTVYFWFPTNTFEVVAKQLLVGLENEPATSLIRYVSPIIPYVSFYLLGIPIGRTLATMRAKPLGERDFGLGIVRLGLSMVVMACGLKALMWISGVNVASEWGRVFHELTSPERKIPPGPTYLLFFSGLGLTSLGAFFLLDGFNRAKTGLNGLAVIGRASFFVYVLQAYIFGPLLGALPIAHSPVWPLFFIASLTAIWFCARAWNIRRGNRLLDIGYRAA